MTIDELKKKAASRYESVLKRLLLGEIPFPVQIPYKRPQRSGDPTKILRLKQMLKGQAKKAVGFGPTIEFEDANTRRFGVAALPGTISFDTLDDLIRYIDKTAETKHIIQNAKIVTESFPEARTWTSARIKLLSKGDTTVWLGIVKFVNYFIIHPKPWVYPRELSVGPHTKFLEQNYATIIDLLTQISPSSLNETYTNWQDRLGLRSSSELVEGRFLDSSLAPHLPQHMLAPVKEWNRCAFGKPAWVLITENRTTFLTLPAIPGCLALLGKGYAVTRLSRIEKLHHTPVYYWGDIDQHGFEILASMRNHLPNTISCLMDEQTREHCCDKVGTEKVESTLPSEFVSVQLTAEERELWQKCAEHHLRLEQEWIPRDFAIQTLNALASYFVKPIQISL
jgi:hypothetical protein